MAPHWHRLFPAVIGGLIAVTAGPAAAWAAPAVPAAGRVLASGLTDVSCPAADSCMAVGWYESSGRGPAYVTLAEAWNGRAWATVRTPSPSHPGGGGMLTGVSCVTSTDCMAVGESLASHRPGGYLVASPLAESWNGTRWRQLPTSKLPLASATLDSVSCTAASACMAVGSGGPARHDTESTLAETWNGTAWTFVGTPTPPTPGGTALDHVSCTSPANCMAVGYYGRSDGLGTSLTLAERWNGLSWGLLMTPNPDLGGAFAGVSCSAASACMAVGTQAEKSLTLVEGTLAAAWNGTSWRALHSPNPAGAAAAALDGISCTGRSACMGTGSAVDQAGDSRFTLAEKWNGLSWGKVVTPSPGNASELLGVACAGSSHCMAVGDSAGHAADQVTLAEAWNGMRWAVVKTPHP